MEGFKYQVFRAALNTLYLAGRIAGAHTLLRPLIGGVGAILMLALEAVIAQNDMIRVRLDGRDRWFECRSVKDKREVYNYIYAWLRQLPTEEELRQIVRDLCARHQVDMPAFCTICAWAGTNWRRWPPTRW